MIKLGKDIKLNLQKLIDTRLLIQANSGGGKSYLIRKLLEETHGEVQQIVLDLEGEFSTLREKFDYVLIGADGDIQPEVRAADLLARKLLENNVSAIIDLYELKQHERIRFVKLFLDSMVNAPKKLWHPCLVIIDEAHIFCPEKSKAESMSSVIDMATRGRKRGYCSVLATQRLSKMHKDAAAECNNKLIGRTGLDVDMKRAGEELGFTTKQQMLSLRDLEAGEFFAFGPAISRQVTKVKIGKVKTQHPESGGKTITTPKAITAKLKKILSKLADLPQKADEEMREKQDYMKRINELKMENRKLKVGVPKQIVPKQIDQEEIKRIKQMGFQQGVKQATIEFKKTQLVMDKIIKTLELKIIRASTVLGAEFKRPELPKTPTLIDQSRPVYIPKKIEKPPVLESTSEDFTKTLIATEITDVNLGRCEKSIYSFLANNPHKAFHRKVIAFFSKYSPKSGGFNNSMAKLNSLNLIEKNGNKIKISNEGLSNTNDLLGSSINWHTLVTIEEWIKKLPKCSSVIFKQLLENQGVTYSREDLGELTGYATTSGGFNNSIAQLNSLGLAIKESGGIKLNDQVFEEYS